MRQTVPYYAESGTWQNGFGSSADDNFSILDQLESYRGADGKFTLKIVWPRRSGKNYNIWKQTSNPVHSAVSGYEPVEIHFTSQHWGGLERNGVSALMDGSVSHGNWFYAIGSRQQWGSGIPGIPGAADAESQVELWVLANQMNDRPRGYLVSQEFCITEGSISMLVGGPENSGVALVLADSDEIVHIANGKNI